MKTTKHKIVYEKDINGFNGKVNSIVFPDSLEEIKNVVKLSSLDVIPRGSGTSFSSQCVPNDSVIIDLSKMNRILKVNRDKKTIEVEAGAIIDDINLELEKHGLELPVDPLFSSTRTIGGMIATNSSGNRELKYGRIRNWIDSLEVINGLGEVISVSKSDASDFTGMEGINGIITKASLRLTTKKQRTLAILKSDSLEEIIKVGKQLKLDQEVSMFIIIGKKLSIMCGLDEKYHLFVEYESDKGNMKGEKYNEFLKMLKQSYYVLASNGYTLLEDPRFFMDKVGDFIVGLEENRVPYFCNLSSGVVYCGFAPESETQEKMLELAKKMRGRISNSFGIGLTKKHFLDKTEKDIIKRIKARHDPENKFNRNKVIDYEPSSESISLEIQEPLAEDLIQKESEQEKPEETETKTPEQKMEEFIEEQKVEELLEAKPIEE